MFFNLMSLAPPADTILSVDGGAIATFAVLGALALGAVLGAARELRRTAAPSRHDVAVRLPRPATAQALAA